MTEIEINEVKFAQAVACKCGRSLSPCDVRARGGHIEFVCSGCHSSVVHVEIRAFAFEEERRWG